MSEGKTHMHIEMLGQLYWINFSWCMPYTWRTLLRLHYYPLVGWFMTWTQEMKEPNMLDASCLSAPGKIQWRPITTTSTLHT